MKACKKCGSPLPERAPGAPGRPRDYCQPESGRPCAELNKRIEQCRKLGYEVAKGAKGKASRAFPRLEASILRAIGTIRAAGGMGEEPEKRAIRKPEASGRDALRVWCVSCGAELAPRAPGAPGRPRTYCAPEEGRPCEEFGKRIDQVGRLGARIVLAFPEGERREIAKSIAGSVRFYLIGDLGDWREQVREEGRDEARARSRAR